MRMMNTTRPTRIFPPTTNVPKVSTTSPASPLLRIDLVVETFRPNRKSVNNNNREGNIENCNGSFIFIEVRSTRSASEIFTMINKLNNQDGNGMISMATINMTLASTDKSLADIISLLTAYI